ncbi:hypothetical protein CPCC7001_1325 [Cyanobium sp. PCC 7001]|uniref:type II toxin-antitoxin system VapC family toxin n=1 Tax=Cyanobium sp. PCC 7001 TaxID=180281 RepID=UPI0001805419|nr:type II toxin-antitoxin system VapC family toxin [Cyanobium sp. PCC 7001]EDY38446.1 hypothetical protein CPCC7001_1325 [Cyanobium sp. PCC 7001]
MVIDPSALVAILLNEPERRAFIEAIAAAEVCWLSAASLVELSIVIEVKLGPDGLDDLDLFLATAGVETVAFDHDQALIARAAFQRFGKGRHPAGLNLGDCCAYALARVREAPLLFKGRDFVHTDIRSALTGPY